MPPRQNFDYHDGRGRGGRSGGGGPSGGVTNNQLKEAELDKAREAMYERCIQISTAGCRFPSDLGTLMSAPAWSDLEMEAAREDLNAVKSRLDAMQSRCEYMGPKRISRF